LKLLIIPEISAEGGSSVVSAAVNRADTRFDLCQEVISSEVSVHQSIYNAASLKASLKSLRLADVEMISMGMGALKEIISPSKIWAVVHYSASWV